jgi:hypothetical protein
MSEINDAYHLKVYMYSGMASTRKNNPGGGFLPGWGFV